MERLELAYTLMALMVIALVALTAWLIYNGRGRTLERQRVRELAAYDARMAKAREEA